MIEAIQDSTKLITDKLNEWVESAVLLFPNLLVAIVVLVAFYFIAKLSKFLTKKLLVRFSDKPELNYLVTTVVFLVVLTAGLLISLNILKLEKTVTSLLAGAGVIGLALGFAFQDISSNFISGIFIIFRKPFKEGDIIETKGHFGKVTKIDFRITTIETFQGLHVMIPNKEVQNNPLTNYTKTKKRRVDLEVGISYGDQLKEARELLLSVLNKMPFKLNGTDAGVFFMEFGGSSVNMRLQLWIEYPDEPGFLTARSEMIIAVKQALDENNFTIPFPIRTLDFGIKGGEKLSGMLNN